MKFSPWILGAAICVPFAGAIAGSTLKTDPIGVATDVTASLPDNTVQVKGDARAKTQPRLPNHYAMETPDGVVEVHELAMRGRNADQWRAARAYEDRIEADLASMEARWDADALDTRAARALDARQPTVRSQDNIYAVAHTDVESPHYAAMERANTGGDVIAVQPQSGITTDAAAQPVAPLNAAAPVAIAANESAAPAARVVNVEAELNLQK